jgi:hypothetical protein
VRIVNSSERAPDDDPLVADLRRDLRIRELVKSDDFAHELYAALTNVDWVNNAGLNWGATFRYVADVVAGLRDNGENYLKFYCSAREGHVSPRVEAQLKRLGWCPQVE